MIMKFTFLKEFSELYKIQFSTFKYPFKICQKILNCFILIKMGIKLQSVAIKIYKYIIVKIKRIYLQKMLKNKKKNKKEKTLLMKFSKFKKNNQKCNFLKLAKDNLMKQ